MKSTTIHGDESTTEEVLSTASLVEASCLCFLETMLIPPVIHEWIVLAVKDERSNGAASKLDVW